MAQSLSQHDIPNVLNVLLGALSADPATQKQAEATLNALELSPGYCSCLAEILGSRDSDHSARWLAATQLKNTVAGYWRARADKRGVTPEEKSHLRGKLMELIAEPDNQVKYCGHRCSEMLCALFSMHTCQMCLSINGDMLYCNLHKGSATAVPPRILQYFLFSY